MKARDRSSAREAEQAAAEVLHRFVSLFEGRGWLNRFINVRGGYGQYRLFCSESRFFAYRMNDRWGISPGAPGWPVCMVTRDRVFHDGSLCAFPTEDPETLQWLRLLADNDFEVT